MKYGLSSSSPPRMSAPSSVCSDDSFEIVNNEVDIEESKDDVFSQYKPKVTFHEVFDVYPMDGDIVAKVTFDHDYLKSDQDTVVVLPIAWKSVDQALCAANINGSYVRFDVKDLPKIGAEDKFYQLCYCTGEKIVMGVSIPFSFREVHEDELVEFQKEQNKEFWTFRSRFAVLTDNYWNSLMEKQANADKLASNSERELASSIDGDQKASKETEGASELLRTSDHFSAVTPEKETPNKSTSDEIGAGEPRENIADSDKITENVPTHDKILLFKIMEAENEIIKQENQKLKSMVFEIIRAISINDRETCRRTLNDAINGNGEVFAEAEFSELRELLRKSLIEPDVVKSSEKIVSIPSANVSDDGELGDDVNGSYEQERDTETAAELAAERATTMTNESYEQSATAAVAAANSYTNEKILLFKIMENENAELKKQYEEEQLQHTEAKNTIKHLKTVLMEIMRSIPLDEKICQKIENSLPSISAAFDSEDLNQVRLLFKKEITELSDTVPENLLKKVDAAFVVTSDGNILFADQWEKQTSEKASETPVDDKVVELEERLAVSLVEREKLVTEVKHLQAIIKDLNEQLINQRQSEVEKMITVTNNMRDQYMKNMSKLTDSNKVLGDKLTEKDKEIETLNRNLLDASKLLTDNEREIRDLKARDHTFVGFLERRNLKRISELRETLQEMYSKRWAERQESAKLKEDLLTTQTMLNSLCDELEKSSLNKSPLKMENSAQTGEKVENSAQTSDDASCGTSEAESSKGFAHKSATENISKAGSCSATSPAAAPRVSTPELDTTPLAFRRIKQREQALATKLVEMTAELEKIRTTHDRTKTDLESRLKDGAKQYAKLYVKYDKLLKRSQTTSRESSSN